MRKILGLVVLAALAASCGGDSGGGAASGGAPGGGTGGTPATAMNPTDEQVLRVVSPVACSRLQACAPQVFMQAYPDGDCVGSSIATDPPSKLSQPSPCSQADAQTCTQDVQTFACEVIQTGVLPGSCQKCDATKTSQTGPNGNNQQVLLRTGWALCRRAYACNPAGFMQTHPRGFSDCVAQIWAMAPAATLAQASACSDAAAEACVSDLKAFACDVLQKGQLPSSCGGGCF